MNRKATACASAILGLFGTEAAGGGGQPSCRAVLRPPPLSAPPGPPRLLPGPAPRRVLGFPNPWPQVGPSEFSPTASELSHNGAVVGSGGQGLRKVQEPRGQQRAASGWGVSGLGKRSRSGLESGGMCVPLAVSRGTWHQPPPTLSPTLPTPTRAQSPGPVGGPS